MDIETTTYTHPRRTTWDKSVPETHAAPKGVKEGREGRQAAVHFASRSTTLLSMSRSTDRQGWDELRGFFIPHSADEGTLQNGLPEHRRNAFGNVVE